MPQYKLRMPLWDGRMYHPKGAIVTLDTQPPFSEPLPEPAREEAEPAAKPVAKQK